MDPPSFPHIATEEEPTSRGRKYTYGTPGGRRGTTSNANREDTEQAHGEEGKQHCEPGIGQVGEPRRGGRELGGLLVLEIPIPGL